MRSLFHSVGTRIGHFYEGHSVLLQSEETHVLIRNGEEMTTETRMLRWFAGIAACSFEQRIDMAVANGCHAIRKHSRSDMSVMEPAERRLLPIRALLWGDEPEKDDG